MRYNPPPNWPQPPAGWTPPPDWSPDPSWGPPPDGWALWVPDGAPAGSAQQGYPPPGQPGTHGAPQKQSRSTAVILGAVGLVVVVGVAVGAVFLLRDDSSSPSTVTASSAAPSASAPSSGSATSSTTQSGGGGSGTTSDPWAFGEPSTVGEYEVTIVSLEPDATAQVLAESTSNDRPEKGQYVLFDIETTYNGPGTASPFFDLYFTLQGSDGSKYNDYDCSVLVPDDLSTQGELRSGEKATGSLCFDAPAGALPGETMSISLSGGDDEAFYRTS